eukprot:2619544-Pyramimonas_sp.AAC.1
MSPRAFGGSGEVSPRCIPLPLRFASSVYHLLHCCNYDGGHPPAPAPASVHPASSSSTFLLL